MTKLVAAVFILVGLASTIAAIVYGLSADTTAGCSMWIIAGMILWPEKHWQHR